MGLPQSAMTVTCARQTPARSKLAAVCTCRSIVKPRAPAVPFTHAIPPLAWVFVLPLQWLATTTILAPLIHVWKALDVNTSHSNVLKFQTALPWSVWVTMVLVGHCATPLLLLIVTTRILAPLTSARKDWDAFICRTGVNLRQSVTIRLDATAQARIQFAS